MMRLPTDYLNNQDMRQAKRGAMISVESRAGEKLGRGEVEVEG